MPLTIAAGWTEALDFQLVDNGAPFPIPVGAALSVSMLRADGLVMDISGTVSVVTSSDGVVRFQPTSTDLQDGMYNVRLKIEVGGETGFFPSGPRDIWKVLK